MKRFEETYLNDRANLWLTSCLKDLQLTFANTFKYVSSLKSLVEIRDVVIAFESEIEDKSLSANDCGWTHVCQALFKKEIHVWLELIAPYYYTQSKVIIYFFKNFWLTLFNCYVFVFAKFRLSSNRHSKAQIWIWSRILKII